MEKRLDALDFEDDEQGIISHDAAVGVEPIVALMAGAVSAREPEAVSSV
jgi:hypothetical protein